MTARFEAPEIAWVRSEYLIAATLTGWTTKSAKYNAIRTQWGWSITYRDKASNLRWSSLDTRAGAERELLRLLSAHLSRPLQTPSEPLGSS